MMEFISVKIKAFISIKRSKLQEVMTHNIAKKNDRGWSEEKRS